jgi:RNA 3'-terminal phosphate cyclase (ATP)
MKQVARSAIRIDGSMGEGGGQILRTALALSCCLGRPFQINNIRANRRRPGLQPQHLAAVRAATAISQARVEGDAKASQQLMFTPGQVKPGHYRISVGTAGSVSLVLQSVLPALLLADGPSELVLEGGTHNPLAPPFEFLKHAFLPLLNRMGPRVEVRLLRAGFAPRGGGYVHVAISPTDRLRPLDLTERGAIRQQSALVLLAHLPQHIAERELAVIQQALGLKASALQVRRLEQAYGPGNVAMLMIESEQISECFSAFGRRGVPAERVATQLVQEVRDYLQAGVPVGQHLADQLLLPMALAGGGALKTLQPSLHALTNIDVIRAFVPIEVHSQTLAHDVCLLRLNQPANAVK